MHYVFITGGVVSSLGKGIISGSLGALLEAAGHTVTCMKLEPYINVDPGTISPQEHGEVYVTQDGAETDLDLGHYERFLSSNLGKANSVTSGQVYAEVLDNERRGDYLGATVQVIPHITDQIQSKIEEVGKNFDITLVEVGGTVGDIESLPFLEAIRQMRIKLGVKHVVYIHLTLLPYVKTAGEMKTKPTQHSVKEMRSIGIQPDILVCRAERNLLDKERAKISLFTNVPQQAVISMADLDSIYRIPLVLAEQKVDEQVCASLGLSCHRQPGSLQAWESLVIQEKSAKKGPRIGLIGKYCKSKDAYKSLIEALKHASIHLEYEVEVVIIDSESLNEQNVDDTLQGMQAIIVAGGFGERGVEGKILAIRWAREKSRPFLGICLGMQLAVIEFCRNVVGLDGACSSEFTKSKNPVVGLIEELKTADSETRDTMGGTMRLGACIDILQPDSKIHQIYDSDKISERHRHRYEVNPLYVEKFQEYGLVVSGRAEEGGFIDIVELPEHPWFIGCQFHPEFNSKPLSPHPLFINLVQNACQDLNNLPE